MAHFSLYKCGPNQYQVLGKISDGSRSGSGLMTLPGGAPAGSEAVVRNYLTSEGLSRGEIDTLVKVAHENEQKMRRSTQLVETPPPSISQTRGKPRTETKVTPPSSQHSQPRIVAVLLGVVTLGVYPSILRLKAKKRDSGSKEERQVLAPAGAKEAHVAEQPKAS